MNCSLDAIAVERSLLDVERIVRTAASRQTIGNSGSGRPAFPCFDVQDGLNNERDFLRRRLDAAERAAHTVPFQGGADG